MDPRYQHPQVAALWSPAWTYDAWWRIEREIIEAQREHSLINRDESYALVSPTQPVFDERTVADIHEVEARTRHDVAAFVDYMREWYGDPHDRWIHFGVTSSDLVDTAQGLRFKALYPTLAPAVDQLMSVLSVWVTKDNVVLGRTHGQPAEPTSLGIRARHWTELVAAAANNLLRDTRAVRVAKVSGPVGTFAHNPPEVEGAVAKQLGLRPQALGASQIVPRTPLAQWANSAAELVHACAKVAMDIRLMNLLGEVYEPKVDGQVGSSSMAHKNNPIRAEQITGLQRVALGYANMLQPVDLWFERDISHSSVERIAVPDLWHIVLHVIEQTVAMLAFSELDIAGNGRSFIQADGAEQVSRLTGVAIWAGDTVADAKAWATGKGREESTRDKVWFFRNYPRGTSDERA